MCRQEKDGHTQLSMRETDRQKSEDGVGSWGGWGQGDGVARGVGAEGERSSSYNVHTVYQ